MDIEPVSAAPPDPPAAPANDIRPDPGARAPARITVIDHLYFQPAGRGIEAQPVGVESRFSRDLKSEEDIYRRTTHADTQWKHLSFGHVTEDGCQCGMVVVRNEEGAERVTVPTPEEVAETASRVLRLGVGDLDKGWTEFALVRPGESCRFEPISGEGYVIASGNGRAKYTISATPG